MFFLFGTGAKQKDIGRFLNIPCLFCNERHTMHLSKHYSYFHAFFIPLFRFNTAYYLSCPDCSAVYKLVSDKARQLCRDALTNIELADMTVVRHGFALCANCGARTQHDNAYCPQCGHKV